MTISNENSSWNDVGDNIVTSFFFDNLVVKATDLDVYLDGILQTIVVDYNVTGAGTDAGSVDFLVAPGVGVAVAIIRNSEEDQLTAYPFNGPFPALSHEAAMDKLTIIAQENTRDLKKALRFAQFSLIENIFVDNPVADKLLVVASDGLSIEMGPTITDITDSEAAAAASAAAAAVSEANAAVSAAAALASEGAASASEIAAAASAAAAAVSAAAALVSETNAAASAAKLEGTSVTSVTPGVGVKVFETQAGKFFEAGAFLLVTSDGDPTKFMSGQVASYIGTTLTINVTQFSGAAPLADWTIRVSGRFGIDGDQVPRTVIVVTGDLDVSAGFVTNTFYLVRPVAEAQVTITIPDATTGGFVDGFEASFHLDLAGSILVTTPVTPPVTPIEGETDLVIGTVQATVTLLASAATDDWQISQDSRPKEGAGLTLFATTFADPIPGYSQAVTDNDDVRYDDPSVTAVTPAISATSRATADLTTQFMADAGVVSDLLNDDLVLTVSTNTTAGSNRDVQFYGALYLSVAPYGAANETLIDETANSGVVTLTASEQTLVFPGITQDIGSTDRIVIKTFSWKTAGGGADPTVDFAVGGKLPSDTPARISIPQATTGITHNSTSGKQGGNGSDQFYHITQLQHDTFPGIIGTDIADGATPTVPVDGSYFEALGTTTRTSYVVAANRSWVEKSIASRTYTASASIVTEDGADIITSAGQVLIFQSTTANVVQVTKSPVSARPLLHVREEQTSGTDAGASSAATNHIRVLNTTVTNNIPGASLGAVNNKITLPAGTYEISASAPSIAGNVVKAFLYNVTDAADEIIGTSDFNNNGTTVSGRGFVFGEFTIAAEKDFELRHYIDAARAVNGLGAATSTGQVEIYSDVRIWRV